MCTGMHVDCGASADLSLLHGPGGAAERNLDAASGVALAPGPQASRPRSSTRSLTSCWTTIPWGR